MKPTKRGYKVWALSDAHTEYMYNFANYCGATPGVTVHGLGASVVRTMTEPVLEKGHCLFFDNYFSTVLLAQYLQMKNTYFVATARMDRTAWPTNLKNMKTPKQHLKRGGHHSQIFSPGVQCLMWMDKKVVPFINTICNPSSLTPVKRKKDGSTVNVSCPLSVQLYNKYMREVDMQTS